MLLCGFTGFFFFFLLRQLLLVSSELSCLAIVIEALGWLVGSTFVVVDCIFIFPFILFLNIKLFTFIQRDRQSDQKWLKQTMN